MNKIYNYFKNLEEKNMISHSFLIGNVTLEEIKEELFKSINDFIFKNKKNIENNPDMIILDSEIEKIKKDEIKALLKNLSTTSQFNESKVYIINKCENLNKETNNALLKTLEEPQNNIYAFLITTNIDSIIPTISSRCQKLFISSETQSDEENEEIRIIAEEFIESIEKENIKTIVKNNKFYSIINDRKQLNDILKYLLIKYKKMLDDIIYNKNECEYNVENISKKILIINDNLNRLKGNLNKNLCIDRFIIEIWRCNNENSRC